MKTIITLVIYLCTTTIIFSQINTDRPDQTESALTLDANTFQVETGILLSYQGEDKATRNLLAPSSLFRYGVTDWAEIRLVNNVLFSSFNDNKIQGIADLEIGTKIQLLDKEESQTKIAFLTHLGIPTGTPTFFSNNEIYTLNRILVAHTLNSTLSIGYNLGYNYFGNGNGDFIYTLSFAKSVNEKLTLYVEPYGTYFNFEKNELNFDTGLLYLINDNLQVDFSVASGISHRMNYMSFGVSWRTK